MIKTFKPKKLRGLRPSAAEAALKRFFEMDVEMDPDFRHVDLAVFDVYEEPDDVLQHAANSLSKVGRYYFVSHANAVWLRLEFNQRAREVILNLDIPGNKSKVE